MYPQPPVHMAIALPQGQAAASMFPHQPGGRWLWPGLSTRLHLVQHLLVLILNLPLALVSESLTCMESVKTKLKRQTIYYGKKMGG